jgi:excisionase family DNA binding protein
MRKRAFFTTFEISQICGVNPTTVQNWVKTKRLKAFQTPGKHRRIRREDLIAFLTEFGMPIPPELKVDETQIKNPDVLVVDDDPDVRNVIAEALRTGSEEEGEINVLEARNGIDALLAIGHTKPDMIILDVRMPDMNGYDVCERLKANEDVSKIKIVAISGDHSSDVRERIIAAGADMFFTKPLDLVGFCGECFRLLEA